MLPKNLARLPITKFLVIGPYGAGKTSFVRAVSDCFYTEPEYPQYQPDKVRDYYPAYGTAQLTRDLTIFFFDTPSHRRFDYLWEMMAKDATGYVLLVDSTRPETFYESRRTLTCFRKYNPHAQFVVAANKQDCPGAISCHTLAEILQLDMSGIVLPCTATEQASARRVCSVMLKMAAYNTFP